MNAPTTVYLELSYGVEKFENVIPVGDDYDYQQLARLHRMSVERYYPKNEEKYGGMGFIQYISNGWQAMGWYEVKKLTVGMLNEKPIFIKPVGFAI